MSLNSIEKLDSINKPTHWQLIRVPAFVMPPRYQPLVARINAHEIAVLGGWSAEGHNRLGDAYLFNSKECTIKRVMKDGKTKFNAITNQVGRGKNNSLVALVSDQNHKPCLIEYTKGARSLKVLMTYEPLTPQKNSTNQ